MGYTRRLTNKDATWARAWTADALADLVNINLDAGPRRGDVAYVTSEGKYYWWQDDGTWLDPSTPTTNASLLTSGTVALARLPTPVTTPWTDVAYDAGDFLAHTGTWTLDPAAIIVNRYLIDAHNTLTWSLYIAWWLALSTLSVGTPQIFLYLPAGKLALKHGGSTVARIENSGSPPTTVYSAESSDYIILAKNDTTNFAAGTFGFVFNISIEIIP